MLADNRKTNIFDCALLNFPKIEKRAGNITPIENNKNIPFETKRVYYLYDIPGGETRGGHAHKNLQQLIIALSGSFDVRIFDGYNSKTFHLDRPSFGLYLVPGIWRELINFSSGSVCLVLASALYDSNDYIRDFEIYKAFKENEN